MGDTFKLREYPIKIELKKYIKMLIILNYIINEQATKHNKRRPRIMV